MKNGQAPLMEIKHLTKTYRRRKQPVLRDLSVNAHAGECIGILGTNGCGKSTLLSILSGALQPDSGELLYEGQPLGGSRRFPPLCGYVPQENPLIGELDAYDNLRLWYCDSTLDLKQELHNGILAMLGIPSFLHIPVKQMSGGMKKRLSIGCAMANDPPVLLLDEPGAALDLVCKEQIADYLMDCRKRGKILWIATHEPMEIDLCDSLYLLQDGQLKPIEYHGEIQTITAALKSV